MKVKTLAEKLGLECLYQGDESRDVKGGYAGDLLSWVMGRAQPDVAWITIMSNINVAAVASLADVSCVILAENVRPDAQLKDKFDVLKTAVYTTEMSAYEVSWRMHNVLTQAEN